jgi:hypothetical protein
MVAALRPASARGPGAGRDAQKLDDTRLFVDDIMANAPDAFVCDRTATSAGKRPDAPMFGITDRRLRKVNIFERKISKCLTSRHSAVRWSASRPRFSYRHPHRAARCSFPELFPVFGTDGSPELLGIIDDITGRCRQKKRLELADRAMLI